jgi:eukaryotic-like serine/threonine-protein kinase
LLRNVIKYFFLGLVLLLVFLSSALLAMRFAIQGREVHVPRLSGLTPAEAERVANSDGLVLSVENRFYSPSVPEGRIVSQSPAPGAAVRRGWKIRVAASLGTQHASVPNLVGQSQHAAGINVSRRGLEIGTVAAIHLAGAAPDTVLAQSPPPEAADVTSPKVSLLIAAPDNSQRYVMPSFVGKPLADANIALIKGGFTLGKVHVVSNSDDSNAADKPGIILRQFPAAGQRVAGGATISFDVSK